MKTLILITSTGLFAIGFYFLNATNNYREDPATTVWIFNDTGNCEMTTVST